MGTCVSAKSDEQDNKNLIKPVTSTATANIDFKIFEEPINDIDCHNNADCKCLQRMCVGFKYYENISLNHTDNEDEFVNFHAETYTNFLNDYIHIIKHHGNSLQIVADTFISKYGHSTCNISICEKLTRHYERNADTKDKDINIDTDHEQDFYISHYDQLHHLIFHLFSMGLRSTIGNANNDITMDNNIDSLFISKRDLIYNKKQKHKLDIKRYKDINNKYNIKIETHTENQQSDYENDKTFLDQLYQHLQMDEHINTNEIVQLKNYIFDNNYDSDSVQMDILSALNQSNILAPIKSQKLIKNLLHYIRCSVLSLTSFSNGILFFYWGHKNNYKDEKGIGDLYDGYSASELYVCPNYSSLKEEILESKLIRMHTWETKLIPKAEFYSECERAKNTTCKTHYVHDMGKGEVISVNHLQAIILYCDWTALCTDFSNTFRKANPFEPLESLKKRHSKYYFMAKYLVEAVNDFGINGEEEDDMIMNDNYEYECGPFYCGLSKLLNIPSFAIYLKGPCSTSKSKEVAITFAKRQGMIIELQNDTKKQGMLQMFFDCSWVSAYPEESERLFIAGQHRLRIKSIQIVQTGQNFGHFLHSFYLFDCLLSGVWFYGSKSVINAVDYRILSMLISTKLNIGDSGCVNKAHKFDSYIQRVFESFLYKKTKIEIHMDEVKKYFAKLSDLLFHSVVENNQTDCRQISLTNILKAEILSIFPNINQVVIYTTPDNYQFNLLSFLSSIEASQSANAPITYMIKGDWFEEVFTESIKKSFIEQKWNIKYENENNKNCLIINKRIRE